MNKNDLFMFSSFLGIIGYIVVMLNFLGESCIAILSVALLIISTIVCVLKYPTIKKIVTNAASMFMCSVIVFFIVLFVNITYYIGLIWSK